MRKKLYLIPVIFTAFTINAETILKTLDEVSKYGIEKNLDYKTSLLSLAESEDDIETLFKFDEIEFSSEIEYDNDSDSNPDNLDLSIDIPIVDQFTITSDLDENLSGDLEFTYNPFSLSESREQSELDYKTSIINSETALLDAEYNAIKYALTWMNKEKDYVVQRKNWELEEVVYNDNKSRYNAGDITLDDLKDSLINWSEARKDFISSEQEYNESEKELYEALGSTHQDVKVSILTISELEKALEKIQSSIDIETINHLKSSNLKLSSISVDSAKEHYNKTWSYEPDITAKFSVPYDEDGLSFNDFTAKLSFSMALDDFNKKERIRAKEYYDISILENTLELNEAEVDLKQSLKNLESNKISRDIFSIEYEQAELLYAESMLLYSSGEYSEIELEESEIYLLEAENSLFESLVIEYLSWLELKQYL